jgi:hypothetical protein
VLFLRDFHGRGNPSANSSRVANAITVEKSVRLSGLPEDKEHIHLHNNEQRGFRMLRRLPTSSRLKPPCHFGAWMIDTWTEDTTYECKHGSLGSWM